MATVAFALATSARKLAITSEFLVSTWQASNSHPGPFVLRTLRFQIGTVLRYMAVQNIGSLEALATVAALVWSILGVCLRMSLDIGMLE